MAELAQNFYRRGWALGTSGNFSGVVSWQPLRLAVTPTRLDKGTLGFRDILEIDDATRVVRGTGQPSSETTVHLAIVRLRGAGAVLHTHSVWNTILSEAYAGDGGLTIEGFEMLKGLEGVSTHTHREWLPIIQNCQDVAWLARMAEAVLREHPTTHGMLLRGHGLYSWGRELTEAKRHVEVLEFLLEVLGRTWSATAQATKINQLRQWLATVEGAWEGKEYGYC